MNTIKYAAGAAMMLTAVSIMTACSNDEADKSYYPKDNVVRITTNVNAPATRGSYTDDNLAEMGLSIKNPQSLDVYTYGNIRVNRNDGSTVWTPAQTMLWQNSKTEVDIVAYAPYNANYTLPEGTQSLCDVSNFPVSVETAQTASGNASDFLVYKSQGFKPYTDLNTHSAISVNFDHAMSLLDIEISLGTEFDATAAGGRLSASPIANLAVLGTRVNGVCNFTATKPIVAADNAVPASNVAPYFVSFTPSTGEAGQNVVRAKAEFQCILVPQTVPTDNFQVTFDVNGITYLWKSTETVTLEGGNSYKLKLSVGKDQVVAGGMSVKKWDIVNPSDFKSDIETD